MRSIAIIMLFFGTIMVVSGYLKEQNKRQQAMKTKIVYRYVPKPLSAIMDDPPGIGQYFKSFAGSDPWLDRQGGIPGMNISGKNPRSEIPAEGEQKSSDYFCNACNACMYSKITVTNEDGKTTTNYKKKNDWKLCKPICRACTKINEIFPIKLRKRVISSKEKDMGMNEKFISQY